MPHPTLDNGQPEVRFIFASLGAFGCHTHRINSFDELLAIANKAFLMEADTLEEAFATLKEMGVKGRRERVRVGVRQWWPGTDVLWPSKALARQPGRRKDKFRTLVGVDTATPSPSDAKSALPMPTSEEAIKDYLADRLRTDSDIADAIKPGHEGVAARIVERIWSELGIKDEGIWIRVGFAGRERIAPSLRITRTPGQP